MGEEGTMSSMASSSGFATARRVNRSLTAGLEKRALMWMAERAPRWVTSDQLTALGLIAQIGAGGFYVLSGYNQYGLLGVIACIVLNWFGDSMDGTLARVRQQQRPRYGFYVDHIVDIVTHFCFRHGVAHRRGGAGHSIAAQVDGVHIRYLSEHGACSSAPPWYRQY